jgi:hypothetical protein
MFGDIQLMEGYKIHDHSALPGSPEIIPNHSKQDTCIANRHVT